MDEKDKKEFEKFMNEQFRILQGHAGRCFQRCWNKYIKLKKEV